MFKPSLLLGSILYLCSPMAFPACTVNLLFAGDAMAHIGLQKAWGALPEGYPAFNAPSSMAKGLYSSGFRVVQMANNHAMDRASRGTDTTLSILHENRIGANERRVAGMHPRSMIPMWDNNKSMQTEIASIKQSIPAEVLDYSLCK